MTEVSEAIDTKVDPVKQAAYWYIAVLNADGAETYARYKGTYVPLDDVVKRFKSLLLEKEGLEIDTKTADSVFVDFRRNFPGFQRLELDNGGRSLISIPRKNDSAKRIAHEHKAKFAQVEELVDQLGY